MATLLERLVSDRQRVLPLAQVVAPLVAVLVIGVAFHSFVWVAIQGNPILNGMILLVALGG